MLWPRERLYELVQEVALRARLAKKRRELPRATAGDGDDQKLVLRAAKAVGVESFEVTSTCRDLSHNLGLAAPAVLRVYREGQTFFIGLVGSRGRRLIFVNIDGGLSRLTAAQARHFLLEHMAALHGETIRSIVERSGAEGEGRARIGEVLTDRLLDHDYFEGFWALDLPESVPFWRQIVHHRLTGRLAGVLGLYLLQSLALIAAWWILGRGALAGEYDVGALSAFALLLLTTAALQGLGHWWQSVLMLGVNGLYRKRILHGATRLSPDEIRHLGSGKILAQIVETEAFDTLAIQAGAGLVTAVIDLLLVFGVFLAVPGAGLITLLYLGWIGVAFHKGYRLYRSQREWTDARLEFTDAIVESVLGRRTRLVQEPLHLWHQREDAALEQYILNSQRFDARAVDFSVVVHRGWFALGLLGILPPVLAGGSGGAGAVAAAVGGLILSFKALSSLSGSLLDLSAVLISWDKARLLFSAAGRPRHEGIPEIVESESALSKDNRRPPRAVLEATHLRFGHQGRQNLVLDDAHFSVDRGERVLLLGASGAGKTTLAALLSGIKRPSAGTILLGGFDLKTLGEEEWAKRVAFAPQFKDNHVFSGTLGFNLLLGRRWPPTGEDLREAVALCHELGLGGLLEKMPGGIHQHVGEQGWKVSQGERSRVYLARALLQNADVVILDESFGALDAETMRTCLQCVWRRANALIVIAHP
ncbi:MAG: ABC transporter ATP-binding protein/permease [Myxococcota bacterium]|jgi:ATP-binding cassette subfamily B protein|nr:ABC transporter ATP-binding protein/permease [Myxococcota bacterium]